jgi:hypothetical protein
MRAASSAQVAPARALACSASAAATSRLRSRLPQPGSGCISLYSVEPTFEGHKLGDASLP